MYICIVNVNDLIAQLAEQVLLNHQAQGSNPCGVTKIIKY